MTCGTVLLLYSHLTTPPQSLVGLSTSAFSLVFELYVQSHGDDDDRRNTPCSAGAKLVLITCNDTDTPHEFVLHLGINGTQRSEIRQTHTTSLLLMLFRLDALALSVIATATWLAGWVAGCLSQPVLYQND